MNRKYVQYILSPTSKRYQYKNLLLFIGCLLISASCNLRPVYNSKQNTGALNKLRAIEIQPINSVEGAEFSYHLTNILPPSEGIKAQYTLKVQFVNQKAPSILQKNSDILREAINQVVSYQLIDLQSNKAVASGKFNHLTSYSMDSAAYSSYMIGEGELELLTKQAAEEILKRLILYFTKIAAVKNN